MADDATVKLLRDSGFCLIDARLIRRLQEGTVIVAVGDHEFEAEAIVTYRITNKRPTSAAMGCPNLGENNEQHISNASECEPASPTVQDQGAGEGEPRPKRLVQNKRKP